MLEIGFTKIVVVGVIALVVIGPERLPTAARTLGALLGRARRYVADVRSEVSQSMELESLQRMRDAVQTAARDVEQTLHSTVADWPQDGGAAGPDGYPQYRHPRKKWRLRVGATPRWYKQRHGVRTQVQSGAARVARFRPRRVRYD